MRLGIREFESTPMNLAEAIEVLFILKPYAKGVVAGETILDKFDNLISQIQERDPMDLIRLLAYMLHTDGDEFIESIRKQEITGTDAITALSEGFRINSLPDLLETGYFLGILPIGWEKSDD